MTRVSRITLRKSVEIELVTAFWFALGTLNRDQIEVFLKTLLSPSEVIMLAKRIDICKQLLLKNQYSEIKRSIKVTEPTIAKMSSAMQRSEEKFISILKGLIGDDDRRWKKYIERNKPRWRGKMVHYVPR